MSCFKHEYGFIGDHLKSSKTILYLCVTVFSICCSYSIYSIHKYDSIAPQLIYNNTNIFHNKSSVELYRSQTEIQEWIFCHRWHPANILFGGNHKTGSHLFCKLLPNIFIRLWNSKCNAHMYQHHHRYNNHLNKRSSNGFIQRNIKKFNETFIVLLNIIRSPVDTILSGYNYHKITTEQWVSMPLNHNYKYPPKYWLFICKPIYKQLVGQYENLTLQDIYNQYNMSVGLAIEYQRYIHCEYSNIYESYHEMEYNLKPKYKNYSGIHINVFRLEDLQTQFNQTMKSLLDALFIRIDEDRKHLLNVLQQFRTENSTDNGHVTRGTYDKQQQINTLLSNEDRCNILKEKTISLDYKWIYHEYC